jgi:hypothetical protein
MTTATRTRKNGQDYQDEINELADQLNTAVAELTNSHAWLEMLRVGVRTVHQVLSWQWWRIGSPCMDGVSSSRWFGGDGGDGGVGDQSVPRWRPVG